MAKLPPITGSANITLDPIGVEATAEVWDRPPETHPIYAKIGRVASNWSHVEHILDVIILDLSNEFSQNTAAITGQLSGPGPRCSVILALLEVKALSNKELVKQIEALRGACYKTADYRNRIVHDAWYARAHSEHSDARPFRSLPKDDLKFGITALPSDYFQIVLDKIQRRHDEAIALRGAILQVLALRNKGL